MSHTSSAPPLDASGVFSWRLLEFLSNKRPCAQEELGNRIPHSASDQGAVQHLHGDGPRGPRPPRFGVKELELGRGRAIGAQDANFNTA